MRGSYILLTIAFCSMCAQSCGINNYFKAKKLKENIAAEDKRTDNLFKKRETERAKLLTIKDSAQRYRLLLKGVKP